MGPLGPALSCLRFAVVVRRANRRRASGGHAALDGRRACRCAAAARHARIRCLDGSARPGSGEAQNRPAQNRPAKDRPAQDRSTQGQSTQGRSIQGPINPRPIDPTKPISLNSSGPSSSGLVWPAPRGRGGHCQNFRFELANGFASSPISEFPVDHDSPRRRAGASGRRRHGTKCDGSPGGKAGVAAGYGARAGKSRGDHHRIRVDELPHCAAFEELDAKLKTLLKN